ncbi:hypothetical protein [Nonomuraea sp. NPDC049607]|uniref:hypothetical protein n=1 Tax=unclassified Nonomuraea TaxID=2593643 RepID=UPI003431B843
MNASDDTLPAQPGERLASRMPLGLANALVGVGVLLGFGAVTAGVGAPARFVVRSVRR